MRHIGNVPTEQQARLFGDYLYAHGVRNEIEADGDSWMIWIAEEGQLEIARRLLERFQHNPTAPEFIQGAAGAGSLRADEARDLAAYQKRFYTRQQVFPGTHSFNAGVVTYILIVICIMVGLFSKFGDDDSLLRYLFISYPRSGASGFLPEVRSGEVWRLFTPAIIHLSWTHLLFNMLMLFQLGSMIESKLGHVQFILLVLGLAVGSNVPQYVMHGPGFGGMSGVIYGLFGYIWLRGKFDRTSGLYIDRQSVILMIGWFFLCMTPWVRFPVANVAHGAGLVLGAGWGFLSALLARRGPP